MGGECGTNDIEEKLVEICLENMKERDHFEDLDLKRRTILKGFSHIQS
jgi:hypothetical protein